MSTIPLTGPVVSRSVRTTDATPTECAQFTPDLDSAGVYKVVVNGTATSGDRLATVRTWSAIRNDAGTTVAALSAEDRHESGSAGWVVDVAVDGTDGISVMVSVTGEAAHDVTWQATVVALQCGQGLYPWDDWLSLRMNDGVVDECVQFGDVYDMTSTTEARSFSFWMKTTAAADSAIITKRPDSGASTVGWSVRMLSTGYIEYSCNIDEMHIYRKVCDETVVNDGNWHHVAVKTQSPIVYVDGNSQTGTTRYTGGGDLSNVHEMRFGSFADASEPFDGWIDEVCGYGATRISDADVTWLYNGGVPRDPRVAGAPAGLTSYWRCGEFDTAPTVRDWVGTVHGTMENMTAANIVLDTP